MKSIMAFILLVSMLEVHALEVQVRGMEVSSGYDRRFDLSTNRNEEVVLDCQSFIHGLFFGQEQDRTIMLEEWECVELMIDMQTSLQEEKRHCLEVDFARNALDYQGTCLKD